MKSQYACLKPGKTNNSMLGFQTGSTWGEIQLRPKRLSVLPYSRELSEKAQICMTLCYPGASSWSHSGNLAVNPAVWIFIRWRTESHSSAFSSGPRTWHHLAYTQTLADLAFVLGETLILKTGPISAGTHMKLERSVLTPLSVSSSTFNLSWLWKWGKVKPFLTCDKCLLLFWAFVCWFCFRQRTSGLLPSFTLMSSCSHLVGLDLVYLSLGYLTEFSKYKDTFSMKKNPLDRSEP